MVDSTSLNFVGIGGESPVAEIAFELDVTDSNGTPQSVPKRVRHRLLEAPENKPRTSSSLEKIEAKLKEADLRCQQFHEWLENKARPKPQSPTRSANPEDLAQRLEAKLSAAEQNREDEWRVCSEIATFFSGWRRFRTKEGSEQKNNGPGRKEQEDENYLDVKLTDLGPLHRKYAENRRSGVLIKMIDRLRKREDMERSVRSIMAMDKGRCR